MSANRMTQRDEVQKAREWRVRWSKYGDFDADAEMLAAYRRDSMVEELEALAKECCVECAAGIPLDLDDHYYGFKWMRRECSSTPIRRRLETLKGEGL